MPKVLLVLALYGFRNSDCASPLACVPLATRPNSAT